MRSTFLLLLVAGCSRSVLYQPTPGGRVFEVACDEASTQRHIVDEDSGYHQMHELSETTTWTGFVPGLRVDPRTVPRLTAIACGLERFGPDYYLCLPNARCTDTGGPEEADCAPVEAAIMADGRVRVHCGQRAVRTIQQHFNRPPRYDGTTVGEREQADAGPPVPRTTGRRFRRAYVRIE